MPEIGHTFGGFEPSNERAHASLQAFDCALRSFAQQCLHWVEHQLDWVEFRRIRRQVAQACAGGLDRLLDADDFVEGDIVDHHNVAALEYRNQTLFDVGQESLAVHGSFYHHPRHHTRLTETSDYPQLFPS